MTSAVQARYITYRLDATRLRLILEHPELVGSRTDIGEQLEQAQADIVELRAEYGPQTDDSLGLTDPFEQEALWLVAAPYLDERFRDLIARANDNLLHHYVDGALCQRVLIGPQRASYHAVTALVRPDGLLHRRGLVRFARTEVHPNPLHYEIVPHADVVGALCGDRVLSTPLTVLSAHTGVALHHRLDRLSRSQSRLANVAAALEAVIGAWEPQRELEGSCVLLSGRPGCGRATHAHAAAARSGRAIIEVHSAALSPHDRPASELLDALCRESVVHGDVVVLRDAGSLLAPDQPWAPRLRALLARWPALVVCCVEDGDRLHSAMVGGVRLRLQLDWPNAPQARAVLLEETLGQSRVAALRDIDRHRLSALSPHQMEHVGHLLDAFEQRAPGTDKDLERGLETAFHSQLLADTGGLAAVSQPKLKLDELVLPAETLDQVEHVIAAVRNRAQVLHGWGLSQRIRRGIGICCLFDGDPGTGKTLSAEVIAGELGLQLLRIDLSNIVDKYVGETEKHLTRIFEKAQPETSILLFDEADALFSKRTEVKSSNDHYANMSINVLLQLIEAYEGVSVLTTNLKQSLDPAFERRIMFKIEFPMPEAEERERLWRHLLPEGIPTEEELDFEALGEVEMSGGSIKNAILRAAYGCAHDGRTLHTDALLEAAWREAAASGRLVRQDVEFDR